MAGKYIRKLYGDNLFRNSSYLILNSAIMSLLGFFFWTLAARNFTSHDLGLATTVISAIGLISLFSFLGFNVGFLRYLPLAKNKGKVIFNAFLFASLVNIVLAGIFLIGLGLFSQELNFLVGSWVYILGFISFSLSWLLFSLVNSVLIAYRKANIVLVKNTVYSVLKLFLLFFLTGISGILISWYLACFIALLFSFFFFKLDLKFDFKSLRRMFRFSSFNYFGQIFASMPALLLPLIITSLLEPSYTAYFYVAWTISAMLMVIPVSVGQSFLTEGSYSNKSWSKKFKKALLFSLGLVGLGIVFLLFFGKMLLNLFSPEYVVGFNLLLILAFSAIPYTLNQLYISHLNLEHKVKKVVSINFLVAFITISGSILFIDYGLTAIGFSWLVGNLAGLAFRGMNGSKK